MFDVFPDAIGGLGDAPGSERALVQPLDRGSFIPLSPAGWWGEVGDRAARLAFDGGAVYIA